MVVNSASRDHARCSEPLAYAADPNPLVLGDRWLADHFDRPTTRVVQSDQATELVEHRSARRSRLGIREVPDDTGVHESSHALTVTENGMPAVCGLGVPVLPEVVPGAAVSPGSKI